MIFGAIGQAVRLSLLLSYLPLLGPTLTQNTVFDGRARRRYFPGYG